MLLLKPIALIGASLAVAIPTLVTWTTEKDLTLEGREILPGNSPITANVEDKRIETRTSSRMTLQWSPQGRVMFLTGLVFERSIQDAFIMSGAAAPAKDLLEHFRSWLIAQGGSRLTALSLFYTANRGGVYGAGTGDVAHTYGFAFQTATQPALGDLQALLTAISDWAGGTVQVISRANGFFSPEQIGGALRKRDVLLKERSRTNQCIAVDNILQYATLDVPDIDINRDIRWGGECDE